MTRKRRKPASPVEWKSGVHIAGTMLWCDARHAREACFVSSAQVPEARRHRQIIATQATLDLLPEPTGRAGKPPPRALAVPYGRPFTLGDLRLELFPSGHMVGAAALLVDLGPTRVVYAGPIDPRGGRLAGAAEVRACDVLVIDATFGHPRFRFPPAAEVLAEIAAWVDAELAAGGTPVLLAPPLSIGPELIQLLGATRPLRAHRAFVDGARKLRTLGVALPPVARFAGTPAPGTVILWPPASRDAAAIVALRRPRVALVSGWALDPAARARLRVDAGFALADQAGPAGLLEHIVATGARTVHLVGAPPGKDGDELTRALADRGVEAHRLGPPEQLDLL